jgi:hypothetical protein
MKPIKKEKLDHDGHYLVFINYDYSPSGYDIGKFDFHENTLDSQTTNENLLKYQNIKIYELPEN